jgi:hypothetical protein
MTSPIVSCGLGGYGRCSARSPCCVRRSLRVRFKSSQPVVRDPDAQGLCSSRHFLTTVNVFSMCFPRWNRNRRKESFPRAKSHRKCDWEGRAHKRNVERGVIGLDHRKTGVGPTGNLSRHSLVEKSRCTSIFVARKANDARAGRREVLDVFGSCASIVHTLVNDLG